MKTLKTQFILLLMALSVTLSACVETREAKFNSKKFVRHYKNSEHVVSFSLPPALLRLFVDRDEKELKQLLKQIDDMRFLVFEDEYFTEISSKELFNKMDKELTANNFKDLLIVKEKDEQVKFKIQETDNMIKELIMLVSGKDELVLINISGNINMDDINLITESFDVHKVHDF